LIAKAHFTAVNANHSKQCTFLQALNLKL